MATFGFNRTALSATQPKLHSMFCALFLFVYPRPCCDLLPLNYYLWDAVKEKCYADKLETIDALKYNIREAIGEYSCTQSIMCLKIGPIVQATAWPVEAAI